MASNAQPDDLNEDPSPPDECEEIEPPDEVEDPAIDQRLWIQAVLKVVSAHTMDPATPVRVQFAIDRLTIAACERGVRILNSDKRDE